MMIEASLVGSLCKTNAIGMHRFHFIRCCNIALILRNQLTQRS